MRTYRIYACDGQEWVVDADSIEEALIKAWEVNPPESLGAIIRIEDAQVIDENTWYMGSRNALEICGLIRK